MQHRLKSQKISQFQSSKKTTTYRSALPSISAIYSSLYGSSGRFFLLVYFSTLKIALTTRFADLKFGGAEHTDFVCKSTKAGMQ